MKNDFKNEASSNRQDQPSDFWVSFLQWFCPSTLYEGIEGDLLEQFESEVKTLGLVKARRKFAWHVVKFFRPGIILRNKISIPKIEYGMIQNYFKVAWRSTAANRGYTVINITGLTLGLTVAIILFWIVRFEYSFDRFHANADRIYQIISHDKFAEPNSHVPQGAIHALREQFPEVEEAVTVYGWVPQVIRVGEENLEPGNTFFIHPEFLKMIDVTWIAGSVEKSLREPYQVVLDKPTAERFFHDKDPLGKVIRYDNAMELTVSGIIEEMPANSVFRMPVIMSYETLMKYHEWLGREDYWGGGDSWFHGYTLLKPGADAGKVEERLTSLVKQYTDKTDYTRFELSPLTSRDQSRHLRAYVTFRQPKLVVGWYHQPEIAGRRGTVSPAMGRR